MPGTYMVVNSYFKKRLTLAMSFQVTGSSIAGIFLPQICEFLLSHFGITGTVLIFAGISFHAIPAAILLKPAKEIACDELKQPVITGQEEKIGEVCVITNLLVNTLRFKILYPVMFSSECNRKITTSHL